QLMRSNRGFHSSGGYGGLKASFEQVSHGCRDHLSKKFNWELSGSALFFFRGYGLRVEDDWLLTRQGHVWLTFVKRDPRIADVRWGGVAQCTL
ncbi:hypothetical protein U1Q18_040355, partial [Sarracenia purpurea var. burkii]